MDLMYTVLCIRKCKSMAVWGLFDSLVTFVGREKTRQKTLFLVVPGSSLDVDLQHIFFFFSRKPRLNFKSPLTTPLITNIEINFPFLTPRKIPLYDYMTKRNEKKRQSCVCS